MTDTQETEAVETEVVETEVSADEMAASETASAEPEHEQNATANDEPHAADDELAGLPVSLTVKLPEVTLAIDAVRSITQGTTIPLGLQLTERMTIEINGQKFGEGSLVQIGDKIGVQIETWKTAGRRH